MLTAWNDLAEWTNNTNLFGLNEIFLTILVPKLFKTIGVFVSNAFVETFSSFYNSTIEQSKANKLVKGFGIVVCVCAIGVIFFTLKQNYIDDGKPKMVQIEKEKPQKIEKQKQVKKEPEKKNKKKSWTKAGKKTWTKKRKISKSSYRTGFTQFKYQDWNCIKFVRRRWVWFKNG